MRELRRVREPSVLEVGGEPVCCWRQIHLPGWSSRRTRVAALGPLLELLRGVHQHPGLWCQSDGALEKEPPVQPCA